MRDVTRRTIPFAALFWAAAGVSASGAADFTAPRPDHALVTRFVATLGSSARTRLLAAPVPVVGCPADGQLGKMAEPKLPRMVEVLAPEGQQRRLAYYKAEPTKGVLAPVGWRCFGSYGSDGDVLVVAPPSSNPGLFKSGQATTGPAITITTSYGGTSGRFEVARIGARMFPALRSYVQGVRDEGLSDAKDYVFGAWPGDKLDRLSDRALAYLTPGGATGLGNSAYFAEANLPVLGVAYFVDLNEPDIVVVRARLGSDLDLYPAIAVNALPSVTNAGSQEAPAPAEGNLQSVTIPRFGCGVGVPAAVFSQPQRPSDNGDGFTFRSPDGAELRILGRNNVASETVAEIERSLKQDRNYRSVTYRAAGPTWLVLTGYRGGREVYYARVVLSNDRSTICTVDIAYPQASRGVYDKLNGEIANSLHAP